MHRRSRMDPAVGPPACLHCGRGNTPDDPDTIEDFWVLDLERDVNWGDPAYLCKYCAVIVGHEAGMVDEELLAAKENEISTLQRRIHELETVRDSQNRRLRAIQVGRAAVRSVKNSEAKA
jgi:hypothetical protein